MITRYVKFTLLITALFALTALLSGCESETETIPAEEQAAPEQTWEVNGIFIETDSDMQTITIIHEEIPDVMASMRMRMILEEPAEAEELSRGDAISFTMVRIGNSWYVRNIERLPEDTELELSEDLLDLI
jgi:Cu/Ag efflux protein CusF